MDQRSGDGWISGWSQIFAFYHRNSRSRVRVTRRENCFSTEQNHPEYVSRKRSVRRKWKLTKTIVSFQEDRSLSWSANTSGSLGPTMMSRTMLINSLLFEMVMFMKSNRFGTEFYLLSMTKIPHDDILEGLHIFRIRESEKFKTVLELYNMEIHQKKLWPDHHRLKTKVKKSIEQDIRNKNFEARNGNYEKNAVVKNKRVKQRGQRILFFFPQDTAQNHNPERHSSTTNAQQKTTETTRSAPHAGGHWPPHVSWVSSHRHRDCQASPTVKMPLL